MTESPFDELILKMLSQDISQEEKDKLLVWVNENEENKKHLAELQKVWNLSGSSKAPKNFSTLEEWKRFEVQLAEEQKDRTINISEKEKSGFPLFYKIAASLLLLILGGALFYTLTGEKTIVKESGSSNVELTLADGTKVWLNKNSRIEYPAQFDKKGRTVLLSGEGFFDVTKDPSSPFIISTNEANVKVLGTSFNVAAYPNDAEVKVYVQTGRVQLTSVDGNKSETLDPGNTGVLNKELNTIVKTSEEDDNVLAWKTRSLVFRKTRLERVIKVLENYYKIKITSKNSALLNCRFTSTFKNAQIPEVIETLSISLNLTISKDGKNYFIDGTGCN